MSCYIIITNISGEPPYEVTVCDNNGNNCFLAYYDLDYVPPTIYVDIPSDWSLLPFIQVTIQSSDGCEELQFIQTTPSVTPTNTVTPTTTVSPTVTQSLGTPTPTPTVSKTPTMTPSPSITPSITSTVTSSQTQTPTTTSTVTPSEQTPTPTQSLTVTPTVTQTITPSISPAVPPYFEVQNINGTNPLTVKLFVAVPTVGQSAQYFVNFGDGTVYTRSLPNPPYSATAYTSESNTYGAGTYISRFSNFYLNSSLDSSLLQKLDIVKASDVITNTYTFSAFTQLNNINISASTISDFQHNLPSKINNFVYTSNSATTFTFSIPNTASYQHFSGSASSLIFTNNTTLTALTVNLSGITQNLKPSSIRVQNNNALKNFDFYVTTKGSDFFIFNNSTLTSINMLPSLSSATTASDFRFGGNRLSAWTQNFPSTATNIEFDGQQGGLLSAAGSFKTFDVNLNNLTSLNTLNLGSNSLTSLTETISACTSLQTLYIQGNRLTSLPPTFPNSLVSFYFYNNMITGYTSNFPTNIVTFRGDSAAAGYQSNFDPWTLELTGSTSLTTFDLGNTMLTSWTKQFPPSIRNVNLDSNFFTNFDFNLISGATLVQLDGNLMTGVTNLSLNNTIQTLDIAGNKFYNSLDIFTSNTPTSLTSFYCNRNNLLTGWTTSFSASTGLTYITFDSSNLNTTAVDFILSDIRNNSTVNGGTLDLYSASTGKPASPTGGYSNPDLLVLTASPRNWIVTVKP